MDVVSVMHIITLQVCKQCETLDAKSFTINNFCWEYNIIFYAETSRKICKPHTAPIFFIEKLMKINNIYESNSTTFLF